MSNIITNGQRVGNDNLIGCLLFYQKSTCVSLLLKSIWFRIPPFSTFLRNAKLSNRIVFSLSSSSFFFSFFILNDLWANALCSFRFLFNVVVDYNFFSLFSFLLLLVVLLFISIQSVACIQSIENLFTSQRKKK